MDNHKIFLQKVMNEKKYILHILQKIGNYTELWKILMYVPRNSKTFQTNAAIHYLCLLNVVNDFSP